MARTTDSSGLTGRWDVCFQCRFTRGRDTILRIRAGLLFDPTLCQHGGNGVGLSRIQSGLRQPFGPLHILQSRALDVVRDVRRSLRQLFPFRLQPDLRRICHGGCFSQLQASSLHCYPIT